MIRLRQTGFSYLFLLPSFLLTAVLGIYPIGWAIWYMFFDYKGYGTASFVGLDNFDRLLRDTLFWDTVVNTFVYAGGKLLITIPLALVLAVILNRSFRGRSALRAIVFLPTIISSAVMAVVFYMLFNSYNGLLNQYLLKLHLIPERIDWLGPDHAMLTAIMIAVWGAIGNYMLLFLAGLQNIPQDIYESSSLDGASRWQQFWYLTVPMLGPVLQMVIMLAIINSLKGYESIMVLTDGGPIGKTEVMYLYVYKLFFPTPSASFTADQQFGYGSAVGFATAVIVGLVTIVYHLLSRRLNQLQ
ncbi:raffinose/stachyose/melibiose transport system permease protein [Paenibacillus phyllosphaerae]|uniref:Raffinose/stachyose/melibiose transport system permease protein n=1 Tax=Paenibacillus phyllosphaerae TaxID=274593 RepID=A0A7W5AZI1_9BACL|nr:sugar ABC transporter permease [Paenibacillus phyllosphaerae]MBB3111512.1 raffinose/stachyose/melibiose transport system permease protein [Paenibacillus phyllosphaerae]